MSVTSADPRPTVWSLVSSLGLVYFVPQLLLFVAGMLTGGFGIGVPELVLLTLVYAVGIPWVIIRWVSRRRHSATPSSA